MFEVNIGRGISDAFMQRLRAFYTQPEALHPCVFEPTTLHFWRSAVSLTQPTAREGANAVRAAQVRERAARVAAESIGAAGAGSSRAGIAVCVSLLDCSAALCNGAL